MRQQCCVHSDIELASPAKILFNLEGSRVGSGFHSAPELSTDKHAVTILDIVFGYVTAGSHLIIGLARTTLRRNWTRTSHSNQAVRCV